MRHVFERLPKGFDEILVVTRRPEAYNHWPVRVVEDNRAEASALAGIESALMAAGDGWVFVTACDAPLLSSKLVALVLSECSNAVDLVIPESEEGTNRFVPPIMSGAFRPSPVSSIPANSRSRRSIVTSTA